MDIRPAFHKQLQEIQNQIVAMGAMVEEATNLSIEALKNRDLTLAKQIIADDQKINKQRFDIEEKCIELIATQQPMAGDLRILVSVLIIATELERMGDHAEGIAKITIMVGDEPPLKPLVDIPRMAKITNSMLRRSLQAFVNRDACAARTIAAEDDTVDQLYDQVFRELLSFMAEDPRTISRATRLIWAAHNLERSADRVTNICERVAYIITGQMEELGQPSY